MARYSSVRHADGLGRRYRGILRRPCSGQHKLAPRVSPGKSWEGAVASAIAAVVVAILLFRFLTPIWQWTAQHSPGFACPDTPLTCIPGEREARLSSRAVVGGCCVRALRQRRRAIRRFGGVGVEAGSGDEGLGNAIARTWRRAGPHRRPAVCSTDGLAVLRLRLLQLLYISRNLR